MLSILNIHMDVLKDDLKTAALFGYLVVMFGLFMYGFMAITNCKTERQGCLALILCASMMIIPVGYALNQRWFG